MPVWHASASLAARPVASLSVGERAGLSLLVAQALAGVGRDPTMREVGGNALHARRHVTDAEWSIVGQARDVRDTAEEGTRLAVVRAECPHLVRAGLL